MSMLPKGTIDVLQTFSDIGVHLYGVTCQLFVPSNLTALESNDAYTVTTDMEFDQYNEQTVWIEWYSKHIPRLRKLGLFTEEQFPILARFKNFPEVKLNSYIKLESQFIPEKYDTDEFEVVDVLLDGMYNMEIYRWFRIAPRRAKS